MRSRKDREGSDPKLHGYNTRCPCHLGDPVLSTVNPSYVLWAGEGVPGRERERKRQVVSVKPPL